MALDEPKDNDETFEFDKLKFVVDKALLDETGGICVDFVQRGFFGGYQIEPKVPLKKAGGGAVLLTSSNAGVFPDYGMTGYITTKAAVVIMAEQMALDLGKYGIRVNALCPGWIDTPLSQRGCRLGALAGSARSPRQSSSWSPSEPPTSQATPTSSTAASA